MDDKKDVPPILRAIESVAGRKKEKLTVLLPDDFEDSSPEQSTTDLQNTEYVVDEDETENVDDETLDGEEEPAELETQRVAELEPQREAEPQPKKAVEKKARIQIDPNASVKDTLENSHYLSTLPVVPESQIPYKPILYTFRVKAKGITTKLKKMTTKPPPFYLQFDHTIAVIWTLFNKEANKNNLGIVQLQWALYFLEAIYNSEGVHPADIQLCINTIQDYLIDKYAEISEESVIYGPSKFGDFVNEQDEMKDVPFSVNYSQMIQKCPPPYGLDTKESILLDKQLLDELENVKKVVGIESIDLTKAVSKDQVMNILSDWKKEQIDKIQEELKMLYVVEDMMKNSDAQNFEGYTDETQFESIFKKNK